MNAAEAIDRWLRDGRILSITLCYGKMSALVFVDGVGHTVFADNFELLVVQVDNLLNDKIIKDCRQYISVIE